MSEEWNQKDEWEKFQEETRRHWRMQAISNIGLLALTAGVLLLVLLRT